jgi:hypothetical protein
LHHSSIIQNIKVKGDLIMGTAHKETGTIVKIGQEKVISERFTLREFILDTDVNGAYQNPIKFQVANKMLSVLEGIQEGGEYEVTFYVNGRAVEGKGYFNSLSAIAISRVGATREALPVHQPAQYAPDNTVVTDDIPF